MDEKRLDHASNVDPEHPPPDEKKALKQEKNFSTIDLEDSAAHKDDYSDGGVDWTVRNAFAFIFLCMLYTGSQIILYFVGGSVAFIAADLKAPDTALWLPITNTLATASIAPYTGYLQDLFGKRYIALLGSLLICIGILVLGTAHNFSQGVAGMALAGAGAGIGELTALAGISEAVPVKHRGYSMGVMAAFIFMFTPYILYSQLLGTYSTWRWTAWLSLIYNGLTCFGLLKFYHPRRHRCAKGFSYGEVLTKIGYLGGFLSVVGLTLFLVALQAGGYTHPWQSAYVLCCLLIGLSLIVAWIVWEAIFAPYPMVSRALFDRQHIVAIAFVTAFVGGMNFYSVLNFLPMTWSNVYPNDPVQVGLKGLPPAISIIMGAVLFNLALSIFRNNNREVLITAAVIMTAFGGALAVMTPDNPKLTVAIATLSSFGVGGMIVPTATLALLVTPDALLTTTAALSLTVRSVGGAVGYCIYYKVFIDKLNTKIPAIAAEYVIKAGLPLADANTFIAILLTTPTMIENAPGFSVSILEAAQLGIRWAYAESLHYVWYTTIAFGSCAILCCVFIPSTAKYQTNRIAVAL